jgi:hypothetical protein
MKRLGLVCALLLLVAVNAFVLAGIATNRSNQPEASLLLTERELPLAYRYNISDLENREKILRTPDHIAAPFRKRFLPFLSMRESHGRVSAAKSLRNAPNFQKRSHRKNWNQKRQNGNGNRSTAASRQPHVCSQSMPASILSSFANAIRTPAAI